jgi:stalled ribosome rescue protein Dom34
MKVAKRVGIWMNYSIAQVIEFSDSKSEVVTIESKFTHEEREKSLTKGESHMHSKEQHFVGEFFKEISKTILHYDIVLLFGPTHAKTELFNILQGDNRFGKIRIKVKDADKMTSNQQQVFVRDYFKTAIV